MVFKTWGLTRLLYPDFGLDIGTMVLLGGLLELSGIIMLIVRSGADSQEHLDEPTPCAEVSESALL